MRLFMIVTFFGQIGAVIGPLPYDEEECLFRASIKQATVQLKQDAPSLNGRIVTLDDIKFECVWRDERPKLDLK